MVDMGRVKMGMGMKRVVAIGVKDKETSMGMGLEIMRDEDLERGMSTRGFGGCEGGDMRVAMACIVLMHE